MGKKQFCFFQTAETGNRAPNSGSLEEGVKSEQVGFHSVTRAISPCQHERDGLVGGALVTVWWVSNLGMLVHLLERSQIKE